MTVYPVRVVVEIARLVTREVLSFDHQRFRRQSDTRRRWKVMRTDEELHERDCLVRSERGIEEVICANGHVALAKEWKELRCAC